MTTEFSYLTFSVFEISDFNQFVDTVKVIFKKQLITGKAEIYSEIPNPNVLHVHYPMKLKPIIHFSNSIFPIPI